MILCNRKLQSNYSKNMTPRFGIKIRHVISLLNLLEDYLNKTFQNHIDFYSDASFKIISISYCCFWSDIAHLWCEIRIFLGESRPMTSQDLARLYVVDTTTRGKFTNTAERELWVVLLELCWRLKPSRTFWIFYAEMKSTEIVSEKLRR